LFRKNIYAENMEIVHDKTISAYKSSNVDHIKNDIQAVIGDETNYDDLFDSISHITDSLTICPGSIDWGDEYDANSQTISLSSIDMGDEYDVNSLTISLGSIDMSDECDADMSDECDAYLDMVDGISANSKNNSSNFIDFLLKDFNLLGLHKRDLCLEKEKFLKMFSS
jgi:hypothetical protein